MTDNNPGTVEKNDETQKGDESKGKSPGDDMITFMRQLLRSMESQGNPARVRKYHLNFC